MAIALILIAVLLALIFIPLQERSEKIKFENDMKKIPRGEKPKEPFSIDPEISGRILFWIFIFLVLAVLIGDAVSVW